MQLSINTRVSVSLQQEKAHGWCFCCLSLWTERERGRERVGDWINYVLSPFSWLKSTLLPLDSLCLCLRLCQMDWACHPVQALPSLLSKTWTFRSVCWGCVVSLGLCCFCVCLSFLSVIHLPSKKESWVLSLLFITRRLICGNHFRFSLDLSACQLNKKLASLCCITYIK